MISWYQTFLETRSEAGMFDYTSLISQKESISDGINHFCTPLMYRERTIELISTGKQWNGYSMSAGNPLLVYGIQAFERIAAGMAADQEGYSDHVRITAGATAAIQFLFSYWSETGTYDSVLLLGLSYYLFSSCAKHFRMKSEVLMSAKEGRILPEPELIGEYLNHHSGLLVFLTLPANPSGEVYTQEELAQIAGCCRRNDSILIIDKCQMDELAGDSGLNIGKAVLDSGAEENTVIVNSFSKVRSLAGARIGYVYCNQKELADYIAFRNELTYFNHALGYESAIIADCIFRALRNTEEKQNKILRAFRNVILLTAGNQVYQDIYRPMFKEGILEKNIAGFVEELKGNHNKIRRNYAYCLKKLDGYVKAATKLEGGYNYCIQIRAKSKMTEEELCQWLSLGTGCAMLSQKNFGYPAEHPEDGVWFRISAAMEEDRFRAFIDRMAERLGKEGGTEHESYEN